MQLSGSLLALRKKLQQKELLTIFGQFMLKLKICSISITCNKLKNNLHINAFSKERGWSPSNAF
jgi:hypothetical protein